MMARAFRSLVIVLTAMMFIGLAGCVAGSPEPARTPTPATSTPALERARVVKIKWLGQSAFVITTSNGTRIVTDPYAPNDRMPYGEIQESADIVTVSHDHRDHNNIAAVGGNPEVVRGTTGVKGIKFKGIPTYHDASQGKERGNNIIICFEVDGMRICHFGDLGHPLTDKQVSDIGKVDIVLIPVGGNFTIDAAVASQVVDRLQPGVVIPMHYKTDKVTLPVVAVDEFLQGKSNVTRLDTSEVQFKSGELPSKTQIMVLKPAL